MRLLSLSIFIFLCQWLFAQPGFIKVLGDPYPSCIMEDLFVDKDTIVTYAVLGTQGVWFAKFDKNGNHIKSSIIPKKGYYLTGSFLEKQSCTTEDGGYAMIGAGKRTDPTNPLYFTYFVKVDHDLNLDVFQFYDLSPTLSTTYLPEAITATKNGYLMVFYDYFDRRIIISIDKQGNELWRKDYGQANLTQSTGTIKKFDDNTYVLGGSWGDSLDKTKYGFELLAIDSLGNIKWDEKGSTNKEYQPSVISEFYQLTDGGWLFSGLSAKFVESIGEFRTIPYVTRLDKDFNLLWEKEIFFTAFVSRFIDLNKTIDDNFIATGQCWDRAIHYKFSIEGDSIWSRLDQIGEANSFNLHASGILSDGSIVSCGSDLFGEGDQKGLYGFLMKFTNDGCIDISDCPDWVDVEEISKKQIDIDIFPNPATDFVAFKKVNEVLQKPIDIEIYDVMGHKVKDARIPVFEQNLDLDIGNLAQGIYFCRFYQDDTLLFVKKLIKQ